MRERDPMTQTINASRVRQDFSQILGKVFRRETRVIVEKSGIPVAAIVSAQDLERLQMLDEQRQNDLAILERFSAPFKDESPEEIERQVARAVTATRAKQRRVSKASAG